MRIYDPRVGRFLSVDPLASHYPFYTPYQFAGNNPIAFIDLDGLEPAKPNKQGSQEGQREVTSYTVSDSSESADFDNSQTTTQQWYWHNGGITQGQKTEKNKTTKVVSQAGWYTAEEYQKIIEGGDHTAAWGGGYAKDLAGYLGLYNIAGAGHNWTEEEKANLANTSLGKFLAGVSDDAYNQISAAAGSYANKRNFHVTGKTDPSSFNVEDMLGLSMILKAGVKGFVTSGIKSVVEKPALRIAYEEEVKGLSTVVARMRGDGVSTEEIAKTVYTMRRELGIKYKSLTPGDLLDKIYQRNITKYGDKLGPSIDYLRQQGKSWEDIINSALRPGGGDINFNK